MNYYIISQEDLHRSGFHRHIQILQHRNFTPEGFEGISNFDCCGSSWSDIFDIPNTITIPNINGNRSIPTNCHPMTSNLAEDFRIKCALGSGLNIKISVDINKCQNESYTGFYIFYNTSYYTLPKNVHLCEFRLNFNLLQFLHSLVSQNPITNEYFLQIQVTELVSLNHRTT